MDVAIAIVTGTVVAATPLLFAAMGELVVERSGVLNLGIEGMMLIGAVTAFSLSLAGWPAPVAALAAVAAGAASSLLFGGLALTLLANQYAAGIALAILGSGLSAFIGRDFGAAPIEPVGPIHVPVLSEAPFIGPVLFGYDPMVYLALVLFGAVWWVLYRTKAGLVIRIIGENPQAAHDVGYRVIPIRYATVVFGGAMAGLGGAYLALAYTPLWVENLTSGRGWIALALVVFASWRPLRVLLGALLFGGVNILQFHAQSQGIGIPSELLSALPYLATILVLVLISRNRRMQKVNFPASLARPFRPGH